MRIVHVVNHTFMYNGNVHAAIDLACAQADLGDEVVVCSRGGSFDDLLIAKGVEIQVWPELSDNAGTLRFVLRMRRLLRERRIDIVHAHMMKSATLSWAASRLTPTRLVTTVHNAFERSAILMGLGDRVIAVSQAVARAMGQRGVPAGRLRTVLNGTIGSARYAAPPSEPETLQHPAVLYLGGLHPRKGIADLLQGMAQARLSRPDLHLYLVGEGPCEDDYRAMVAPADAENIHFCGARSDPRPFMRGADVFVLASHADPAPLVLSEAREAGLAIIATDVDGVPELLDGGQAGLLIAPRAPDQIAETLLTVLAHEASLQAYRERSQRNIGHLSLERVARETRVIYEELLPRRTALGGGQQAFQGQP